MINNETAPVSPKFNELITKLAKLRFTFEVINCEDIANDPDSPYTDYVVEAHIGKDVRMIYFPLGNIMYIIDECDEESLDEALETIESYE